MALTQVDGSMVVLSGGRRVLGCNCANNSGTPNTQYDLSAGQVTLADSGGSAVLRMSPGTITNNISTAGPTANGRDQSGAFSNSSWAHFYWIWNGSTLATVSSATAPPTGPTLPSGYTHWAYAGAVRIDGSGNMVKTRIRGSMACIATVAVRASAAGTGAEQSYDISANIPPNHLGAALTLCTNRLDLQNEVRLSTSGDIGIGGTLGGTNIQGSLSAIVPLASQTVYFLASVSATTGVFLSAYRLPNGGE